MKYSLLLLSMIAAHAYGQIIYTDVIPEQTFPAINDTCFLDLDNDGITDFLISYRTWSAACPGLCSGVRQRISVGITPMANNAVADTLTYPSQIPSLAPIGPTLSWNNTSGQYLLIRGTPGCIQFGLSHICLPGGFTGQWIGGASETSPKFLGLRFDSAGSTFYGWARLSIPSSGADFTLKDYAYNSVPNQIILAGDTGSISTGLVQFEYSSVQVSPNPFTSTLSVSLGAENAGVIICTVRALTGQALIARTISGTGGRPSFKLDLASLVPGMYLLEVVIDGDRIVRKVMKE